MMLPRLVRFPICHRVFRTFHSRHSRFRLLRPAHGNEGLLRRADYFTHDYARFLIWCRAQSVETPSRTDLRDRVVKVDIA
jgi:hypothetical protein